MFRKTLTHLIILALTALPVQVISAGVENSNMQMSMKQKQASNDCLHAQSSEQVSEKKSCCDDKSHQCQSCNNCSQVTSTIILPSQYTAKLFTVKKQTFLTSQSLLIGVPQKNLLRPPRTIV